MGKLLTAAYKSPVDILYDNITDPKFRDKEGNLPEDKRLCIRDNGNIKFGNLNGWKAKSLKDLLNYKDEDISRFTCSHGTIRGAGTPVKK
jgi:hypothetical protein